MSKESERRYQLFEGFFVTRDLMAYSSQRPFDFNAGGKGADLLRMKIFSERNHFKINMRSSRCKFIPQESDICPGRISWCAFCKGKEICYHSGGNRLRVSMLDRVDIPIGGLGFSVNSENEGSAK